MKGRAGWYARGGVLCLIGLLAVGYVSFNVGLDRSYTSCRLSNDVIVCNCVQDGYLEEKNIFTEAPVFSLFLGHSDRWFAQHMASVYSDCDYKA